MPDLFLRAVRLKRELVSSYHEYPFSIPAIGGLHELRFESPVTCFIGENGSGKSTLLEGIAVAMGFNAEGGSKNFRFSTRVSHSDLHEYLQPVRSGLRPRDGYFLRAESFYNVATAADEYGVNQSYGGSSLHAQSHGESFMALVLNRLKGRGLYLFDEPEAALLPTRQLSLMAAMQELVRQGITVHPRDALAYSAGVSRRRDPPIRRGSHCAGPVPRDRALHRDPRLSGAARAAAARVDGDRPARLIETYFHYLYPRLTVTNTTDRNREDAPLQKKLKELYQLIEGMEIAMFTTRRPDGHLVSRPMATQTQAEGTDLWFVTDIESNKLDELGFDPHVNLAYYKDRTREWVSVSGTATISQDRKAIHELYQKDWKAWFGDQGGERDGGPDDPRLALILVDVHSVTFLKVDKPWPVVLFEVAKGIATGTPPKVGNQRELSGAEIDRGQ